MPRKVGVVVKVRRFMPQRIEGGRLRRMRVEVGWVDILGSVSGGRLSIGSEGSWLVEQDRYCVGRFCTRYVNLVMS